VTQRVLPALCGIKEGPEHFIRAFRLLMRLVVHASRHGRHWRLLQEVALEWVDLQGGERAILSLQLPEAALIVFDPVTHTAQFLKVRGEEVSERQKLSMIFGREHTSLHAA
jgi:hypothetical protein